MNSQSSDFDQLLVDFKQMIRIREENHKLIENILIERLRDESKLIRRIENKMADIRSRPSSESFGDRSYSSSSCVHCSKCHNRYNLLAPRSGVARDGTTGHLHPKQCRKRYKLKHFKCNF